MESTNQPKVACRICALAGQDNKFNPTGMSPHLRAHKKEGWTRKKYLERWPEGKNDFQDYLHAPEVQAELASNLAKGREKQNAKFQPIVLSSEEVEELADPNLELLLQDERKFYTEFYATVLQAVDRDEVQMPMISSLALDVVIQKRLRKAQLNATKGSKPTPTRDVEEALEKVEKRIQSSMKALCITREMLLKTREQWKSTAAGLISGYLDEIERQSPESLDAMMIDEKRVLARMHPRVEKMLLQYAKDIEPEQDEEENDGSPEGIELGLESALQRAGIAF